MSKVFQFLAHLWEAAYNVTPEDRKRSVRIASGIGIALVVLVIFVAGKTAGQVVPAEHPIWEAVLQARLILVRLLVALPLLVLAAFAAVTIYQVVENTELGRRLLIWASSDDAHTQAQKTRNGGALLASLLAACIVGLLLGVLR